MKSIIKKLGQFDFIRSFVCWLGANYIRLVYITTRWKEQNKGVPEKFWKLNRPFIIAFWHGRILMTAMCWPKKIKMNMLISKHRDGEIITKVIKHFNINSIRGSSGKSWTTSNKGGASALRKMKKAVNNGECVGITPDGPKGPRMHLSDGILFAAQLTNAPIIPVTYSVSKRFVLNTWDKFIFTLPFSKGVFIWGNPIKIERNITKKQFMEAKIKVERSLNVITKRADLLMNKNPIKPA